MLTNLPIEILGQIQNSLSRHDISRLTTTCKYIYNASLPFLYIHLELGYHVHIRQLQNGIAAQSILKSTILEHTRQLTLRSRQNGNNWRIEDLIDILGPVSKVEILNFCDFHALSTNIIQHIVSILPHLKYIQFKYCHLVYNPRQTIISNHRKYLGFKNNIKPPPPNTDAAELEQVSFIWTDFTQKAIILFPQITRLELGSNRNKYNSINGLMVHSLYQQCPNITHLTITLPQVTDSILCDTITNYGKQLQHLSIRCDGPQTLVAIATHATHLQQLTLRATPTSDELLDMSSSVTQVIENCKFLEKFEIISGDMENDVPDVVWESIIAVADSSKDTTKICRAQQAILARRNKKEQPHQEQIARPRMYPSVRGSIWFYTVSEEALEQRYQYNNSIRQYQKNNKLDCLETLVLTSDVLSEGRRKQVLYNSCQIDSALSSQKDVDTLLSSFKK